MVHGEKEKMKEKFNLIDEQGNIIGEETREKIHRKGLLHREIHVWLFNKKGEILFQRRGPNKDTFPNLLDASSGGHVDLDESYESAATRELDEELGIQTSFDNLIFLGTRRSKSHDPITNNTNNSFKKIYAYQFEGGIGDLKPEKGELTSLEFWSIEKLKHLTEADKKRFIQGLLSEEYLSLFDKIKPIIGERKK